MNLKLWPHNFSLQTHKKRIFALAHLPQVAVIKGKFHEQSSNIAAYVRFSEEEMAVKATAFNGNLIEGHAVRVDLAAAARF